MPCCEWNELPNSIYHYNYVCYVSDVNFYAWLVVVNNNTLTKLHWKPVTNTGLTGQVTYIMSLADKDVILF